MLLVWCLTRHFSPFIEAVKKIHPVVVHTSLLRENLRIFPLKQTWSSITKVDFSLHWHFAKPVEKNCTFSYFDWGFQLLALLMKNLEILVWHFLHLKDKEESTLVPTFQCVGWKLEVITNLLGDTLFSRIIRFYLWHFLSTYVNADDAVFNRYKLLMNFVDCIEF